MNTSHLCWTASSEQTETQLPESGRGQDDSINYMLIAGGSLVVLLLVSTLVGTGRRQQMG